MAGQISLLAAHSCQAPARLQTKPCSSRVGVGADLLLAEVGARGMWQCPSTTSRFLAGRRQGTSTSSWDLPADVPRRAQPHAPSAFRSAPFACLPRGSGQSPLGVRSEAGTLRQPLPRRWLPSVRVPGQEVSFPPRQVGKARLSHCGEDPPAHPGEQHSSKSAPDQSPSRLSPVERAGRGGNHL